jgi:hypothetical protein
MIVFAALEAPTVVSCFDDVSVVSEAIEQRGDHLGVREDTRPSADVRLVVASTEVRSQRRALLGNARAGDHAGASRRLSQRPAVHVRIDGAHKSYVRELVRCDGAPGFCWVCQLLDNNMIR